MFAASWETLERIRKERLLRESIILWEKSRIQGRRKTFQVPPGIKNNTSVVYTIGVLEGRGFSMMVGK